MASAKSSRSRASGPLGPFQASHVGGAAGGGGEYDVGEQEDRVQLVNELKIFKTDGFEPDAYLQSKFQAVDEKGIRKLYSKWQELKKVSADEMRRSVYANYAAFIRTSKEISDLEGELLSIKNLLSAQANLIHGLTEGVQIDSISSGSEVPTEIEVSNIEDQEPSDVEKWAAEFPDMLDVLLAERRVYEALDALDEAEHVAEEAKESKALRNSELLSLQSAISERCQEFADQLAEATCQPSTRGAELRTAASALKRLGDGPRAHSLLLIAHNQRLEYNMQIIHPGTTSYGGAYTAALSQQVFSAISQALSDSQDVFGNQSAYTSELVVWATKQAESLAQLVKRHVLALSTAAGGLRAAAECVQIAVGHCSLLEARGLSLSSVLLQLLRPSVEQALDANLNRIEESTAALAAADDWVITYPPSGTRTSARASNTNLAAQPKLSSSAHHFNSMVQDFFEDVGPLINLQLGASTLDGLLKVFNTYISLLINALPGSMDDKGNIEILGNKKVRLAVNESQQLVVLSNASLLAEELLPRAAMKLSPTYQVGVQDETGTRASNRLAHMPLQREWKRKLQRSVDRLRDHFCRQHALDLKFLSAEYINMDLSIDESDWAPSAKFQELYTKLNRMANIASEMFVGRERFATLLMMRLTEKLILWLSEDQTFWEDIEQGFSRALGPLGIQQFLILFGQGRFLSRHVHQLINDIIERAMIAFSASGMDPDSVLPIDDWFIDVAEKTISRISHKAKWLVESEK